jgi:ACT domain-containing protein
MILTLEEAIIGVAGLSVTTLLVLIGYTGDRMQKSIDQLREMLDKRLEDVSIRLASIDKDFSSKIADITQENFALDRRITRVETMFERREGNGNAKKIHN